jgi:uncharacterized protein (TIGR03905 family)
MKTVEKNYTYTTRGTCSRQIRITLDGDTVKDVTFVRGCMGNTTGISQLVRGMRIDDVISRLEGIDCGGKGTSCPDQLARALRACKEQDKLENQKGESI